MGGSLGDGAGALAYDMVAAAGSGDIAIAGDCVGDLDLGAYADGEITISGLLLGDLEAGNPHDVTISGAGTHTGNISFTAPAYYIYDLTIGDPEDMDDTVMEGDIYARYGTQNA